ncbi:restriction endonuclease subunit S [Vibrio sp. 10N.222.55.F12]|uniref:restriction endonuclease subunit S n=1 Tax=Vibrio sp. 10N.222.55.F12 TaxID=3229653 RepID=UPI0035506AD1
MSINNLTIDKSSWLPTKLGDLATEISVRVANPSESNHKRFVGLQHFVSGDLTIKNWQSTDNLTSSGKEFEAGDILFARRNAYLKRASLVGFGGVCSGDAFVLRENHELIVPGFLAFIVNSEALWSFANANAAGTMSKRVKWRDLAEYEILLPPKNEQDHISNLLSSAEKTLNKYFKTRDENRNVFDSLISKFFKVKELEFVPLENISEVRYGITLNSKRKDLGNKLPYLRVANVARRNISLSEVKEISCTDKEAASYQLKQGDILVVEGHADINEIGRSAVWDRKVENMLHQNHLIRVRCDESKILPEVLNAYINSAHGQLYFQRHGKSTSGLNTINSSVVKKFKVPVIEMERQIDYLEKERYLLEQSDLLTQQLINYKKVIKIILNKVF